MVNPVIPVVPKDVHFFKKVDVGNDSMFGVNCDTPVSFQDYIPSDLLRNLDDTLQESTNSSRPMQDAFFGILLWLIDWTLNIFRQHQI